MSGPGTAWADSSNARSRAIVIIPAYNEAETIAGVIAALRSASPDVDRLVVTDGSQDETPDVIAQLGERHLPLYCNVGYGRALQAGIRYALDNDYEIVVLFDGDGQHDARDVPRMIEALDAAGVDVVIGSRFSNTRSYAGPAGRRFGQIVFSQLTRVLGGRIYDTTSGFKAMRADACRAVVNGRFLDFHTEVLVRLSLLGYTIAEVPITVHDRVYGRSMHSLSSAIKYPVKTLLLTLVGVLDALSQGRVR